MAAGIYNFTIEQGSTFQRTFKYKDSNGDPLSLANHDIFMDIRESVGSPTTILDIGEGATTKSDGTTTENTQFTVSSSAHQFTLVIDADTTASMSFDTAVYDIEISDNATPPVVTRLLQGKIKLSKEVTR
tara:strand:+ start:21 stop:410 length:390 start_codon:yes stop_codon:yes gene_type:complete